MKRWFLIPLFLLWAPLVSAQSYVGGTWNSTSSGTTLTTAYSPVSGNGVLVFSDWIGCNDGSCTATQTVTSIQNQSSSTLTCFVASPGTRYQLNAPGPDREGWVLYFCPSINSGVTAIKLNWSASVYSPEVYVFEFESGAIQSSNFWDANDNSAVTSVAGMSHSVSVANANAHDLMIAFMHNGSNAGPPFPDVTGGAGWTTLVTNPAYQGNDNFQVKAVSTSASQTATITWGTIYNCVGVVKRHLYI